MPHGITRIRPWSNRRSERIEASSETITAAIPRDTNTSAERYVIFTGGEPLPEETKEVLEDIKNESGQSFQLRALSGHDDPERADESYPVHAITYENTDTYERATYLFAARRSS